ncbi:hypothetical protein B0A52_00980 [Exophiala mesophila]|uniref:Cytomegalovirus gH-receptor family protein n=1 Tax=Exophiala mesophila TaxID=212818 RepID=A0A438NIR7_EXOME|nr:hypothetical protein B0A52_00980 [Exophiala mesophila]
MDGAVATELPVVNNASFDREPLTVLDGLNGSMSQALPLKRTADPHELHTKTKPHTDFKDAESNPQDRAFAEESWQARNGLNTRQADPRYNREAPGVGLVDTKRQIPVYHISPENDVPVNSDPCPDDNIPRNVPPEAKKSPSDVHDDRILKLSPDQLEELTSTPDSLPLHPVPRRHSQAYAVLEPDQTSLPPTATPDHPVSIVTDDDVFSPLKQIDTMLLDQSQQGGTKNHRRLTVETNGHIPQPNQASALRPPPPPRSASTPGQIKSPKSPPRHERPRPSLKPPISSAHVDARQSRRNSSTSRPLPSPMPSSLPLPPLSIPTYLQLELSSQRPSQLYIHQSTATEFPYESSSAKIERLLNFLLLPPHLESVLWFGTLACLDAWLYTFTILPLRLFKSFYILAKSWATNLMKESSYISGFVYSGAGRMWNRRRSSVTPRVSKKTSTGADEHQPPPPLTPHSRRYPRHHHRTKSVPSTLLPDDKADMLKGFLIICTCLILFRFDASRMYHWIRGQAAIKLYVIYNLLEVCDRLFSAIGQDVLECLFSRETLERKPDGHSKILRPLWLFLVALIYTVIHSTALFYQVITLNVAVNSYSNALITLLMSNQFVEIKSTVFKKFEKENLFQLTCADVVERFQLWHMLVIIASRNIVETGGLTSWIDAFSIASPGASSAMRTNSSSPVSNAVPPVSASSIIPRSFTLVPTLVSSITSYAPTINQVLGPFLIVLGSEMLVDWLKHAYINKFNNTRPAIYNRFLDVLAKDYYTNAFGDQNLTKRLGLPVIPLSCLLIRASVQTYQMFVASWVPSTPPASSTSLESIHEQFSTSRSTMPMTTGAAISRTVDDIIKAIPAVITQSRVVGQLPKILTFLLIFLLLLACKLVLGMVLLTFSRARYRSMKQREKESVHQIEGGRRVGGWGMVEVDDDKRRWIYDDDPAGLRALREKEEREKQKQQREKERGIASDSFDNVRRYEMVAKRIW